MGKNDFRDRKQNWETMFEVPLGSDKHRIASEKYSTDLRDKKDYDKYLICFPNKFSSQKEQNNFTYDMMYRIKGLKRVSDLQSYGSELMYPCLFSENETFMEDKRFSYIERYEAEANLSIKQITVAAYITDGEDIILLFSRKGRISNKYTLIQGHVEYREECFFKTQFEILRDNMLRELTEEIKSEEVSLVVPDMPKYFINTDKSRTDICHFAVVYEIRVSKVSDIIKKITSGEPDKHDVRKLMLANCRGSNDLDAWSSLVIDDLIENG